MLGGVMLVNSTPGWSGCCTFNTSTVSVISFV